MTETFTKPFTQQEPIPEAGIDAAIRVMRNGRLHRYNTVGTEVSEVAAQSTVWPLPRVAMQWGPHFARSGSGLVRGF
jgi:hypothetical protein